MTTTLFRSRRGHLVADQTTTSVLDEDDALPASMVGGEEGMADTVGPGEEPWFMTTAAIIKLNVAQLKSAESPPPLSTVIGCEASTPSTLGVSSTIVTVVRRSLPRKLAIHSTEGSVSSPCPQAAQDCSGVNLLRW